MHMSILLSRPPKELARKLTDLISFSSVRMQSLDLGPHTFAVADKTSIPIKINFDSPNFLSGRRHSRRRRKKGGMRAQPNAIQQLATKEAS